MSTIVVLTAPQGLRKEVRIAQAKQSLSVDTISVNDLLNHKTKKMYFENDNGLTMDEFFMQKLVERISTIDAEFIILNGFPNKVEHAILMEKYGIRIDLVISLPFPKRIARQSMKMYQKEMKPLFKYYISKRIPVKEVFLYEKANAFIHALMYK